MPISRNRRLHAYVVGVAIGDGNLSNPNGRATRLRITCDLKYPKLIKTISASLQTLLPRNKVAFVKSRGNYLNISVYSNHLEGLLGWQANGGSKFRQRVSVPQWIAEDRAYTIACLRGLLETDGAIYRDREYPMVTFSSIIPELAHQVQSMFEYLGFHPHTYTTENRPPRAPFTHQVRLSKNVRHFLNIVKPLKE